MMMNGYIYHIQDDLPQEENSSPKVRTWSVTPAIKTIALGILSLILKILIWDVTSGKVKCEF